MYRVAYEEGKRLVDDQVAELDSMRQRSVQFLAFVGSATAFLVGTGLPAATRGTSFFVFAASATLFSIVSILLVLAILLSSSSLRQPGPYNFQFRMWPDRLIEMIEPEVPQPDEVDFLRALAQRYEKMSGVNEVGLKTIRKYYVWFVTVGFIQLLLWGAVAWTNG